MKIAKVQIDFVGYKEWYKANVNYGIFMLDDDNDFGLLDKNDTNEDGACYVEFTNSEFEKCGSGAYVPKQFIMII